MEAFLVSTGVVAVAEIGDKTQLLALLLASRFRAPLPIIAGIAIATLANHALAAWLGAVVVDWLSPEGFAGGSVCRSWRWPPGPWCLTAWTTTRPPRSVAMVRS